MKSNNAAAESKQIRDNNSALIARNVGVKPALRPGEDGGALRMIFLGRYLIRIVTLEQFGEARCLGAGQRWQRRFHNERRCKSRCVAGLGGFGGFGSNDGSALQASYFLAQSFAGLAGLCPCA